MHAASSPAASMPAATHSRRSAYSAWEIDETWTVLGAAFLVRGKLAHRLGDLLRAGHEEVLLGPIERHGGDVGRGHPRHRPIQVVERVLRDDRRDLRAKSPREVVLVDDQRLAGLAYRAEDRVSVKRRQRPEVDDLHAHAFGLEL